MDSTIFFVNIGQNLAKNIEPPSENVTVENFLGNRNNQCIFLSSVEESEIIEIVKNWKNKKSTGFDNILDMTIVKQVIPHIVKPVSYICNMSLTSGIFPNNMKIAKVIPLYKANGKNEFTNYRPVSLLPQFSKILEKLFGIRLDSFIDRYNLLSGNQYGFRRNMSTSLALMELTEEITTALDDKKVIVGVFIDLKKAFDTINHNLLLKKASTLWG